MLRNFITVALRNMRRQMLYSVINIVGLAVGMACSIVMLLYVYGEWSHDRHFKHADRIYRIGVSFFNLGQFAKSPDLLKEHLPAQFAGIEQVTTFDKKPSEKLYIAGQLYNELVYNVDSSFFQVFGYEFISGNKQNALDKPSSVVLTASTAKKYFGKSDALGQTIEVGKDKVQHVVTGVVADDDRPSHLKAKVWIRSAPPANEALYWTSASVYTYLLLKPQVDESALRRGLDDLMKHEVFPTTGKMLGKNSLEEYLADPNSLKFYVHPLTDIYLKSSLALELSPAGNETNMIIFLVIALAILVLAAVNFINLATARATRRAKEVGVRKSLGTSRRTLVGQFLIESVVVSVFSMLIALCLVELFSLAFLWITGEHLTVVVWSGWVTVCAVLSIGIVVGLLAGLYPAFYLTQFQPSRVLKGNVQASNTQRHRDALVVFQFATSIALIIATTAILTQLEYMRTKDLGFDQQNTVTIDNLHLLQNSARSFSEQLKDHPGVIEVSLHTGEPGSKSIISMYSFKLATLPNALTINTYFGDEHYLDVMGLRLVTGRNFDARLASDTASLILNESAARALGIQDNPIGQVVNSYQKVIGVVSDFHWESLRSPIGPVAIVFLGDKVKPTTYAQLAIKMKGAQASSVLKHAEDRWKQLVPEESMQYHFLDDNFGALLRKEAVFGKAIAFFTALAILISALGLFGLAAYTTDQRTKEIGVRKVLGASSASVVLLLNKKFIKLILVSTAVAAPIAYYVVDRWLQYFAYRIDFHPSFFLAGGLTGLVIGCLTVAYHSFKASQTNPSQTLKCE